MCQYNVNIVTNKYTEVKVFHQLRTNIGYFLHKIYSNIDKYIKNTNPDNMGGIHYSVILYLVLLIF